jgi:WD40 repeat protein
LPNGIAGWKTLPKAAAFSPDGKILALLHFQNSITLWDAETGQQLKEIKKSENEQEETIDPTSLLFSPNGKTIFKGTGDRVVAINIESGETQVFYPARNRGNPGFEIADTSPDGRKVLIQPYYNTLIWTLTDTTRTEP